MVAPTDEVDWDQLGFVFKPTDVMYVAEVESGKEWEDGQLVPYGEISISPAAAVLNYGQGIFEGMKAQRTPDGEIVLFRTPSNAARFASGAERLGMPPVPEKLFVDAVKAAVAGNARWVPPSGKGALYIRPCLWGSGSILGVAPAPKYTFMIYCCPVGPYFKGGMTPISLLVSEEFHRAAPGGQGGVKAVGNYAPGMVPSQEAKKKGFAEIIYLDAREKKYIEEVGAANFFCVKDGIVYTPELVGTILPGITRATVIQLARDMGHEVREERVDIAFALTADEAFCTGTAAVISPIGRLQLGSKGVEFCGGKVGEVTQKFYDTLLGIQLCSLPDPHGWVLRVEPEVLQKHSESLAGGACKRRKTMS